MLNTGIIINSRYRIVKILGQGGFGAVYRAWDINLNNVCALKMNLETSNEAQRQFQREASTLSALSHPNLPRVTDHFFVVGQGQFLVMDYVDGEDLEAILAREGQLSPERALPIITQIADALAYLHRQEPPIIHRDIKPANIRLTADGRVFLVDFGLVKVYDQKLRTTIGARAVTPGYSPPEQYGQGNTDARTDVYALAATLYTMLTGAEPQESVQRIVEDKLYPATQTNPTVTEPMSNTLLQAMSLNPSQRYQSVDELMRALQQTDSVVTESIVSPGNSSLATNIGDTPSSTVTGFKPVWWVLGTAVLLSSIFLLFILPNSRQQAAQELALQITEQANRTAVAQTRVEGTAQAVLSIATQSAGTTTAVAQATHTAQAEALATRRTEQTATAVVRVTRTAQAEATATRQQQQTATTIASRATYSARATATQQANYVHATATVIKRNSTISTIESLADKVYVHNSGSLVHEDDDFIEVKYANIAYKNFIVEADFVNPYSEATGLWDYGFLFRDEDDGEFRLTIFSYGDWDLTERSDDDWTDISSGSVSSLRTGVGKNNKVKLICRNGQGWLFVNDEFVTELDLSSRSNSGDIAVATGIFSGNEVEGEETLYTDFTVWALP